VGQPSRLPGGGVEIRNPKFEIRNSKSEIQFRSAVNEGPFARVLSAPVVSSPDAAATPAALT
jgi:hypothetical protein